MNSKIIKAHLALLGAASMWGLMSPMGKAAMEAGVSGLSLATLRMTGGAVCFWITSFFVRDEKVPPRDLLMLFFAALLSIVFNQGCFTFGLSLTSPIDASIITTTMPLITMVLAALFLKEPVTPMKVGGIFLGSIGALMLVVGSQGDAAKDSNLWGDLLCLTAQFSFACYLTIFKKLIAKYSVFTLMKWMFTYASICFLPFSYRDVSEMVNTHFATEVWLEVGYVVLFGTYCAYILMLVGQKALRPTVVSMYNYVQPIVSTLVSVILGMGVFGWEKAAATLLIFAGVYLVTQSKSRAQMLAEKAEKTKES